MNRERCYRCKRYSSSGKKKTGFCMKWRKTVGRNDICGYFDDTEKKEFKIECKIDKNPKVFIG